MEPGRFNVFIFALAKAPSLIALTVFGIRISETFALLNAFSPIVFTEPGI